MKSLVLEPGDSTRYSLEFEETPENFYVSFRAGDIDDKPFTRIKKTFLAGETPTLSIDDARVKFQVDNMQTTRVLASVLGSIFGITVPFPESLYEQLQAKFPETEANVNNAVRAGGFENAGQE